MVIHGDLTLDGDFANGILVESSINITNRMSGEYGDFERVQSYDAYTGETEVTPTDEDVTLATGGLIVAENIIVRKIPSNYGKVTYNGAYILVE